MFQNSRLFSIAFPADHFKVDMRKELQCGRIFLEMQESSCLRKQLSFLCQNHMATQYVLRSILIHDTFSLQQQALIATANARFTAIFISLNSVTERKVISSLPLALLPKITLVSAFHIWEELGI